MLAHLAVANCSGHKKVGYRELNRWLNNDLGQSAILMLEDPVEDVFITNINTPEGNRRIFEGTWESNSYFLQVVIETLLSKNAPQECRDLYLQFKALLTLSECIAERLNLPRWHIEESHDKGLIKISRETRIEERARAVTFTNTDLERMGVKRVELAPFIFSLKNRQNLLTEHIGHSSLERYPLIDFGDAIVVVLPHAISPAIRRFVLYELRQMSFEMAFGGALGNRQARQVEKDGLRELRDDAVSLIPPKPDEGQHPSLHSWLLKYDTNKYIHVVLLHDRSDWLEEEGLSSYMEYPEQERTWLEHYLNKVATYCQDQPEYAEGMTLLVIGGLGRGFMLGFREWPENWRLSFIRISDLLMLSREIDHPIKRYLKCIKQKEWAEQQGIFFQNFNGDFNFYCYWRQLHYQLIPREMHIRKGSMISIRNDFVLPVRRELRNLIDSHVVQTSTGQFAETMRFGRDSYFKSVQELPIYASLSHLRAKILAGVVETFRGPSWFIVMPQKGEERMQYLLYEFWSGFIILFYRLVITIEELISNLSSAPLEIRLNLCELNFPEDYEPLETYVATTQPDLLVDRAQHIVEIKFPADFFIHFQQSENTGEKLTLQSIARALITLHQDSNENVDNSVIEALLDRVIGDSGLRILHMFHTYYPLERLLAQQEQKPSFIAHEDFVFSKLKLLDGCTSAEPEAIIKGKNECNNLLHKVVEKVCGQLCEMLKKFDITSVIRQALAVHESVIHDRSHWERTARAVIALYSSADDVFSVVQQREKDRNDVALPARTILEMAICECPLSGGNQLSSWELEELLAKAALLIEAATDSDAIYSDFIEPIVQIHRNGEYIIDHSFLETMIRPYFNNYTREGFEDAANEYSKLYQRELSTERRRADELYEDDFIEAFTVEFGLTPDEAIDGQAELLDLAVEKNSVVVETTLGTIRDRLINNRGLTPTACQAFLKMSSLFRRPMWNQPPAGFKNKDLNPWRFRRRLSIIARPLLVFGEQDSDKVFYGAGSLSHGSLYLIQRSERGHLPQEFFASEKMRRYIGSINDARGHSFAESVADELRKNGWNVRNEVNMTELGAQPELGDIDVLAWKTRGDVLVIECKRLQLARTVAEIAEICRRFQGEAKDELHKHIRRVDWVKEHTKSLKHITNFIPVLSNIDSRLVTNTHVPMMYLTSLPMSEEKILPLNRLIESIH